MAGLFTGGSLELPDILQTIPDTDEFVPVDQFFQNYVEELNARSKRAHEPGYGLDISKAAKLSAGQTAGGLNGTGLPPPQAGVAGGMQPPYMPAGGGMMLQGLQAPSLGGGAAMPQVMPIPMPGLPGNAFPATVPGAGAFGMAANGGMQGTAVGAGAAGAAAAAGGPLLGLDLPFDGFGGSVGGGGGGGPNMSGSQSGRTADDGGGVESKQQRKTAKQQEANKIAQQRYRERKKQKFHEMEATIEQLTKQLQTLQALQSRNNILEGMNSELQAQLLHQEREVERLKLALDVAAERSLGTPTSSADGEATVGGAEQSPLECADDGCVTCDVLPQDMAGIDFKKGFSDQVELLRRFVQQHGLGAGASPDVALSKELAQQLAQLVGRSCQLCQAALRAEGVKVMELISRDPSSFSTVDSTAEQQRWQRCLEVMHLRPDQQESLLLHRRTHLQRMRAIYQERHNLNMQAMSMMLPHSSKNPAEDNTVEGRMANMSQCGYLQVAKSSAELGDVLDKIKDNLRREQRAVMDLNCICISKILTPLQAAHYMLVAYPHHCDALALSNTLAKALGREAISDSVPPAAAAIAQASTGGCAKQEGCC